MKTWNLFFVMTAILLTSSCKKDLPSHPSEKGGFAQGTLKNGRDQRDALKVIDSIIHDLSLDPNFRDLVVDMVGQQFDGDYNVLIKDIIPAAVEQLYPNPSTGYSALEEVERQLSYFEDLNGWDWYPQIHIPYYEEQAFGTEDLISVIFLEEDTIPDNYGNVADYNAMEVYGRIGLYSSEDSVLIDGYYAQEREVWVISLNETVDDNGQLPGLKTTCNSSGFDIRINKIAIKDHKESWVSGKSEVNIITYKWYSDGLDPTTGQPAADIITDIGGLMPQGTQIRKFTRDEVDNWTHIEVNETIECDWETADFGDDPVVIGYAIFEYDAWPWNWGSRTAIITLPNSSQRQISFKSADIAYVKGRWMSNTNGGTALPYADSWHFDGDDIELDLETF